MNIKSINSFFFTIIFLFVAEGQALKNLDAEVHPDFWINKSQYDKIKQFSIIDFWFTSCAPCIYTMPHLNKLHSQFGKQIAFQSITFDGSDKVKAFLKHHPIDFPIGIDTSSRVINYFGIDAYPTTLILKGDAVLWKGYPNQLTSELIADLTGCRPFFSSVELEHTVSNTEKKNKNIEVIKNEYIKSKASGSQTTADEIYFINQDLPSIFSQWLGINKNQIISSDSSKYDIRYQVPANPIKRKKMDGFIEALIDELDLLVTYEKREVKGYEALISDESKLGNYKTSHSFSSKSAYKDRWEGKGITISELFYEIENRFNIYIKKDQNFSNQRYDLTFQFDLEQLIHNLEYNYGLRLLPTTVSKSFYVIN
jgi:thiol-disulfide isomerase/thioredoxin